MNRKELVNAVAAHVGLEPRAVDTALRGTVEVIEAVAAKGEQVTISGFAKFARVDRPARMARNPATGEPVRVKASKKAKITALKGFKDAVMSPSAAPKLAKGVWPTASKAAPAKAAVTKKSTPTKRSTAAKPASRPTTPAAKRPAAKAVAKKAGATKRSTTAKKR